MSVEVGDSLRMVREAKGLKLSEVATAAKISVPFLSLIEQGSRQPSLNVLNDLAVALKVPVEAFILASQPKDAKIKGSEAATNRLVESINRFKSVKEMLRKELESCEEMQN